MNDQSNADARALTAEIVASYVANNSLRSAELPDLISSVYASLTELDQPVAAPAAEPLVKPVSVKKSVHADYLVSMEDGKQYQSLKRHLTGRGLTPAEYRTKWDLPSDYPMVASRYSERRSALAKSLGLGQIRAKIVAAKNATESATAVAQPKRGRRKASTSVA